MVAAREKVILLYSIIIKVFKLASVQPLGALSHSAPACKGSTTFLLARVDHETPKAWEKPQLLLYTMNFESAIDNFT